MTEDIQTKSQALLFYVPVTVKPDVLLRATLRTSAAMLTSANYSEEQTVNQVTNAATKVCKVACKRTSGLPVICQL